MTSNDSQIAPNTADLDRQPAAVQRNRPQPFDRVCGKAKQSIEHEGAGGRDIIAKPTLTMPKPASGRPFQPGNQFRFQPGNPGGPGRPPTRINDYLRRLAEADDPTEITRLLETGMRNPVIAVKLNALQSPDAALANKAAEQVFDRIDGRARQTIEHDGGFALRLEDLLFEDALPPISG